MLNFNETGAIVYLEGILVFEMIRVTVIVEQILDYLTVVYIEQLSVNIYNRYINNIIIYINTAAKRHQSHTPPSPHPLWNKEKRKAPWEFPQIREHPRG